MSNPWVDSSLNNFSITATAAIVPDNPKFGTGCGFFSGTSATVPLIQGGPLDLSFGDWSIEFWFNAAAQPSGEGIMFETSDETVNMFYNSGSALCAGSCFFQGNDNSPNQFPQNQWNHFAMVMQADAYTIYANGISTNTSGGIFCRRQQIDAGTFNLVNLAVPYVGYMDEFRISTIARYTGNFTPPAAPFVADGNTSLLLHMDIIPLVPLAGKFVPSSDFKAIMIANPGSINPRIYPPLDDNIVRVKT